MICLDLISVEITGNCTFKRKWTIQGQYRLRVSTYWLEMQKNTNEIIELDLFSFRPLYCKAIIKHSNK